MKKLVLIALVLLALFALTACGKKPNTVAKNFFQALQDKNFEAAKKLSTFNSQGYIEGIETMYKGFSPVEKKNFDKTKYTVEKVEVDGDTATITYKRWKLGSPESNEEKTAPMVKEDGAWLVDLHPEF